MQVAGILIRILYVNRKSEEMAFPAWEHLIEGREGLARNKIIGTNNPVTCVSDPYSLFQLIKKWFYLEIYQKVLSFLIILWIRICSADLKGEGAEDQST